MNCPKCGTAIMDHFRFCGSCGEALEPGELGPVASVQERIDPSILMILATALIACAALGFFVH